MKEGDYVVSLGDAWISPGSVGRVQAHKSGKGSVLVKWLKVNPPKKGREGAGLYHSERNLRVCKDGYVDPNLEFKIRRQK